ncbi:MAG: DegV family protein [Lachnospiraceae bacterium]|nr:DegV family protein [Lachnospiraceae bacterium]
MMKYIISTDSTADLPDSYIKEHGIVIQFLSYAFGDEVYGAGNQMEPHAFYERMRSGEMPTTNACIPNEVQHSFETYLAEGYDILHISFSSGLSASYNNARIAANELMEQYPERKILLIDSLCASLGQGLLVHYAVTMKENGKTMEEVAEWLEQNKLHLCHQFTVDDLYHLHRGGRVSKATAILGTLINVKPVLHVDDEGHLTSVCNVRGRKKSLIKLVDNMEAQIEGFQNDIIFISHGDCLEDAEFVAALVRERFGIENIMINYVSPTIGSHSGPGTVALFHLGRNR